LLPATKKHIAEKNFIIGLFIFKIVF